MRRGDRRLPGVPRPARAEARRGQACAGGGRRQAGCARGAAAPQVRVLRGADQGLAGTPARRATDSRAGPGRRGRPRPGAAGGSHSAAAPGGRAAAGARPRTDAGPGHRGAEPGTARCGTGAGAESAPGRQARRDAAARRQAGHGARQPLLPAGRLLRQPRPGGKRPRQADPARSGCAHRVRSGRRQDLAPRGGRPVRQPPAGRRRQAAARRQWRRQRGAAAPLIRLSPPALDQGRAGG
ncbi:hypothetical protein OF001_U10076 [Pseudomonas sp. OF001]|nr:hypothetical protein OF001_U10076 [Pseudomonas sp. OF001]